MYVIAVIANWNGGVENLECIASLIEQGLAPSDIVFVDNASTDGSTHEVARRFPGISLLVNWKNLGFGEASNQGALLALERGAEAVLFVNNDIQMPKGTLAQLVRALEDDPNLGIIGPRVLYKQDPALVWCAGGMMTWRENLSTLVGHRQHDGPRWQANRPVDYVVGCALLARSEVLREIGLFDAQFFAYMEDIDLCLRCSSAGFGVALLGEACAYHSVSSATGGGYNPRRKYMMGVNSIWFLKRHASFAQWMRFFLFDVLSLPLLWISASLRGEGRSVLAKAQGIIDGLRGIRVTGDRIEESSSWLW